MRFLTVTLLLIATLLPSTADEKSGPGRTTLETFDGGTIYAVNSQVSGIDTKPGETVLKTKAGKVVVRMTAWGFDIIGPNSTVKLNNSLNDLTIEEGKKKFKLTTAFGGKTVLSLPDQKMTFEEDGFNIVNISGPKGTLKVEDGLNELKLVSPVGTTVFSGNLNSAKREGPPMERHPYTYRAFVIERNGVGILLDLMPYHHSKLRNLLDWSRVKAY